MYFSMSHLTFNIFQSGIGTWWKMGWNNKVNMRMGRHNIEQTSCVNIGGYLVPT